ncbi:MAG: 4'-phosphopantetheinyl transferase superfamily protein [Oscillospiraceae bacterium]|jgi:4'-phosphopantetheinyl transferase|nr:4'-phosphopantetheinyl transferase superfamily protein [Oscillospiraceae bacterium]
MLKVTILTVAPELTQTEFDTLLPLVSKEKQERLKRFRFFRDAQNSLLGDVLARIEICRVTGLNNNELVFSANEYGKPFLTNNTRLHFNISHTENYVACAIGHEPVGIDIERIKRADVKIAERFFAPDETAYIMESSCRFFEVWTKKESRIKWEGKGLSKPLPSFSVFDSAELEKLNYYEVFRSDDVICHVCSSVKEQPNVEVTDTILLTTCASWEAI